MSAAAVLASNKVATDTEAFIEQHEPERPQGCGSPQAGWARCLAVGHRRPEHRGRQPRRHLDEGRSNDLGVGLLSSLVNDILHEYQYTSNSGAQTLAFGDRVRVADDFAGSGTPGQVYQYMGTTAPLDLGTVDYTDLNLWKPLDDTNIVPDGVIMTALQAFKLSAGEITTYYALIDRNDVQGAAEELHRRRRR